MTITRAERYADSARKIRAPFQLDTSLCIYSPQENRDAMTNPRVAEWLDFIRDEWTPEPDDGPRLALLMPCTKYKPYPTSREHRAINSALLARGWKPRGGATVPDELLDALDDGQSPDLLDTSPLERDGVVLDRFVVSEPLALVPYAHVMTFRGGHSPATAYDDPGLFESRGTSVSPWREDCTAIETGGGRWRWGPAERDAYVDVHEQLVDVLGAALARIRPSYTDMVAWVSPGLTHRSFLADAALRQREHLPATRSGARGPRRLVGVLDTHPGLLEILPTRDQLAAARERLAVRLAAEGRAAGPGAVRSTFARGDGTDTPLGLPEALDHLMAWLDARCPT